MPGQVLDFLARNWPGAAVKVTRFSSDGVDIELRLRGEVVVVQYQPNAGYGVSLLSEEPDDLSGFRHVFATAEEAIGHLASVLNRG